MATRSQEAKNARDDMMQKVRRTRLEEIDDAEEHNDVFCLARCKVTSLRLHAGTKRNARLAETEGELGTAILLLALLAEVLRTWPLLEHASWRCP